MPPVGIHQKNTLKRMELDWRGILPRSEILERLQRCLTEIDLTGELDVEVASSASKTQFAFEALPVADPLIARTPMLIRYPKPFKKRMATKMRWFVKLVRVVRYLVQRIGERETVNMRQAFYTTSVMIPGITYQEFKSIVNDLAVTLNMHPTSLGLVADEDGEIYIGSDLKMRVVRHENILRANKQHPPSSVPIPNNHSIPSRVMAIRITKGTVRAVIVTEHKNLGTQLHEMVTSFKDCIVVMTQGFPTLSAREFLHLLWKSLPASVPFLFFSDHDLPGTQIFTVLKYGCLRNAWASQIMHLPNLTWAGPTVQELYTHHQNYIFGARLDEERKKNTNTPEDRLHNDARKQWGKMKARLDRLLSHPATNKEWILYNNYFKRLDLMRVEDILGKELELMMEGKTFSVAILSHDQPCGLESFIIEKVDSLTGGVSEKRANAATIKSQDAINFDNAGAQSLVPTSDTAAHGTHSDTLRSLSAA